MTLTEFLLARIADRAFLERCTAVRGVPAEHFTAAWDALDHTLLGAMIEFRAACRTAGVQWLDALPFHLGRRSLRALALPYTGHPDYDEAWRP